LNNMSGHSKWNNIKRKKGATDAQRAKIFTKIGREIAVAVREGGADPASNSKLKDLIAKAKSNNVPNDNIERCIKKAAGSDARDDYESIQYEGYGPCGVAVIVETLTDNRNRTAGDLRHYFDKYAGNLGQTGCVSFLFAQKGIIVIENEDVDPDKLLEDCFEAGAIDVNFEDDVSEVFCDTQQLYPVKEYLTGKGYHFLSAENEFVPSTYVTIDDEENIVRMSRLLEMLDDNDDVQNVWHNWVNEPEGE